MSVSLRSLSDQEILSRTDTIAAEDRRLTLRFLTHLHEIERRKLYLTRGYGSMFDYCTSRLRLSEPAAVRRIRSARCLARFPELHDLLASGEVSLTTVSMVSRILKPENRSAVIEQIRGKSKRDVEVVIAEYEPRAALKPDRVRTIVVPVATVAASHLFAPSTDVTVAGDGKKSSTPEPLAREDRHGDEREKAPAVKARFERCAVVEFTAREDVLHKLERVRSLASHRLAGNATLEQVIGFLADYFVQREDPAERQARRQARQTKRDSIKAAQASRRIPARVRDDVFVRDGQRCTYIGPDGNRCGSTHVLQIDHIHPVARGGNAAPGNLRLLCANHNRLEAERLMGRPGPGR